MQGKAKCGMRCLIQDDLHCSKELVIERSECRYAGSGKSMRSLAFMKGNLLRMISYTFAHGSKSAIS